MGAIQNSVNQAMAAAAVAGRLIKSQQSQDINAGIAAKEVISKSDERLKELEGTPEAPGQQEEPGEIKKAENEVKMLEALYAQREENMPDFGDNQEAENAYILEGEKLLDSAGAAKKALGNLKKEQSAILERKARAERAIKKAKNWGGNL